MLVLVSGLFLQACVSSSHGIVGSLAEASGMEYVVPSDVFFTVRKKEGRSDAFVVALPAGTYVLEAVDDTHAYFVAPRYAVVWDIGGLANDYDKGESIRYEDFYNGRSDDYALYKPGCRPGGIKVPFVDTVPAKYQTYFYYCPRGTWNTDNVDASRIPSRPEESAKNSGSNADVGLVFTGIENAESGKLVAGYPFFEGSEGFEFLSNHMPPISGSRRNDLKIRN